MTDEYDLDEEESMFEEDNVKSAELKKSVQKKPVKKKKEEPKVRYQPFVQQQRIGIADSETGEVVAEGEVAVLQTLAEILNRLERIEFTIGGFLK